MPDLPSYIETNDDVKAWEDYLNSLPKEEVTGFLLDRMIADNKLFDLVKMHFLKDDSGAQVHEIIQAFDNELNRAYKTKSVDTEFVIAITRHFMRSLDAINENEKAEVYKHMLEKLNDGVKNYALGWPDDTFVAELIEDIELMIAKI